MSTFEDCTVTQATPLRIRRDCDDTSLPFEPDSLIDATRLTEGDRVRVEFAAGRAIVHGKQDGDVAATETSPGVAELATQSEVDAGTDTNRIVTPSGVRNAAYAPWAMAAGVVTMPSIASGTGENVTVTFPASRFTQTPIPAGSAASGRITVSFNTITTTGAIMRCDNWSTGLMGGDYAYWHAVQMTSGAASG